MPQFTPFFERLEPLNETRIWKNWSGYLVAPRFQYSIASEYYAIRNGVSLLDTSPLFKYRFSGGDAQKLLQRAMVRDVAKCKVGQAQYTAWCDEKGFVVQDGVVLKLGNDDYWLTAGEPALRYFRNIARDSGLEAVEVTDISSDYGILALQGPHAHDTLIQLCGEPSALKYFRCCECQIEGKPVVISRTGYTGDLGYEIWVRSEDALPIWDAIMSAGGGYNIMPIGTTALKMSRVEAGLLLMDVDFHSSRYAWVDAQRETPVELGWEWMFRKLDRDNRDFVGRAAIEKELKERSSRWKTVGLEVDWQSYDAVHLDAGILPPKLELYEESTKSIYRRNEKEWDYAGYASSFLYSSLLKRPIALAKLPLDLVTPGTEVDLEIQLIRKPVNVLARVTELPFFDPARKSAMPSVGETA